MQQNYSQAEYHKDFTLKIRYLATINLTITMNYGFAFF